MRAISGQDRILGTLVRVIRSGNQVLDGVMREMGRRVAERIMLSEQEALAGPDDYPTHPDLQKGAHEAGSAYIGDQKVQVKRPRLRDVGQGEGPLKSSARRHATGDCSEELWEEILRGGSTQKDTEPVLEAAQAFGVSPSSVCQKMRALTAQKLKAFQKRSLAGFTPGALLLDTIHRGGAAFLVARGVDVSGQKMALGFWQGSAENHEICEALFKDLARRGRVRSRRILFVTDGGRGLRKALRERVGKKRVPQRCAIHQSRNLQRHGAKPYRKAAHRQRTTAREQTSYAEAKQRLRELEAWRRTKNEAAADSLLEAFEEMLPLPRLTGPTLLRKTLMATDPSARMCSRGRHSARKISAHGAA